MMEQIRSNSLSLCVIASVMMIAIAPGAWAQSPEQVRRAFVNLRSDQIRDNCGDATAWLFLHREALKDQLLRELNQTDRQGRDAILHVLFNTESFVPDEQFRKLVISRLAEEDKVVDNLAFRRGNPAHWEAWTYMDGRFDLFAPLLIAEIARTESMFVLWGATWLLAKHDLLQKQADLFSSTVMTRAAAHLRNDETYYNASQATRFFLLLGKASLPTLQKAANSDDPQTKSFAKALGDAIRSGNREAFGYLNAHVAINRTPTQDSLPDPEWLSEKTEKYLDNPEGRYP